MTSAGSVLKQYWGYDAFRQPQEEVIAALLEGRDVFAMMPTGGGKSLCYQVPAMLFEGVTFVISPLIALIEDQVQHLQQRSVPAGFLHSGMDRSAADRAVEDLLQGAFKIFYLSPERLQSELFLERIQGLRIDFLAVDEAHCISQWGHDFRPTYRKINEFRQLYPQAVTLALTASATPVVKKDIIAQLSLLRPKVFERSVVRHNLSYEVEYQEAKSPRLADLFAARPGTGIIYCGTRRRTVVLAHELSQHSDRTVLHYHAGMHRQEKEHTFRQWTLLQQAVVCATSAFGMGIDKADVRTVAHFDMPTSIEQYYQEVGRAGRDGLPAKGILLYDRGDINRVLRLPEIQYPPIAFIKEVYDKLMDHLQVAVGEGAERVFAFEIADFTQKFQLPILETISALRVLEQEGHWVWSDDARTQYTVRLTTTRTHIEYLEKNYPPLYAVVEVLLRNYGSVFHFDTAIAIFDLSKMLKIDKTIFEDRLYRLQDMGILRYEPAIVGSFICLLAQRFTLPYLQINELRLKERKAAFISKVQALVSFVEDEHHCRNVLLARYFGQAAPEEHCGNCDNCERHKASSSGLQDLVMGVVEQHEQVGLDVLIRSVPGFSKEAVFQALRLLIDQQRIHLKDDRIYI